MTFGKMPGPSLNGNNDEQKNRKGGEGLPNAIRVALAGVTALGAVATTELAEAQQPQGQEKSRKFVPGAKRVAPGIDRRLTPQRQTPDGDSVFLTEQQKRPEPKPQPKQPERVTEDPVTQVIGYSKMINTAGPLKTPNDVFRVLASGSFGGTRPYIPEFNDKGNALFYPQGVGVTPETRPVFRMMLGRNGGEPFPSMAVRVGQNQILVSDFSVARLQSNGNTFDNPPLNGVNLKVRTPRPALLGEHAKAPILSPLPEVDDKDVPRGTYAVSVGQAERFMDEERLVNQDQQTGTFFLKGFLLKPGNDQDGVLGEMVIQQLRNSGMPDSYMTWARAMVASSFVLVGDLTEAKEMSLRAAETKDVSCMPVYAAIKGSQQLKRMGYLTMGPIYLTEDGSKVTFDEKGKATKPYIPVYIVHGKEATKKALGQ